MKIDVLVMKKDWRFGFEDTVIMLGVRIGTGSLMVSDLEDAIYIERPACLYRKYKRGRKRMSMGKTQDIVSQIRNKYIGMSVPVKAAFWFTVCNFLQRGISMITTPIFTRMLSTDEYGLYSTYLSWETVLAMVVTLSLYKAMMNLYVKYDDNQEKILSALCGLELLLSLIWLGIGIIFQKALADLLQLPESLVCCLFVSFIFQAVFQCWSLYKRYVYDYRTLVLTTLISTAGSAVLGVVAVAFFSPTAESRVISSTFVTAIIGIVLYVTVFKNGKSFFDKKVWLFSLGFCIPLMPHYLSEFVLQSSDKIMINYLCGTSDVALYSIAYSAGSLINLITGAINSTFAPYQYQKIKAGEYELLAKRANQVLLFVGVMLAGIMLFSREIVLVFGGIKYIESVDVIIPICIGVYFNYMFQLFARVQEYYERKLTVVIPSILCAILNLILNYIFIKLCGYQAAAYTTFVCYAIFCLIHYYFYKKVCKEVLNGQRLYDGKGILWISIGVTIVGIAVAFINHFLWLKYSIIIAILILLIVKRNTVINIVKDMIGKEK